MEENNRKFIVNGTNKRNSPKGHFLVQLNEEDIETCKLKSNSDVIIIHDTGETEIVDGEEKEIQIKVLARLHKNSEVKTGVIRLDQTIRAAIGVTKKNHRVSVQKVPKNRKRPISEWLFGFGRQRSIVRVFMASFTDMEVDICRIKETTMGCIGIDNSDRIIIESTTNKIDIRALNLSGQMAKVREGKQKEEKSIYFSEKILRLSAIRKNYEIDDDLPWIFIDFDARNALNVKKGDPVVIYRDNGYAILKNIRNLTIPLVAFLIAIVRGSDYFMKGLEPDTILLTKNLLYLVGSLLIVWFNLKPIRNKFK